MNLDQRVSRPSVENVLRVGDDRKQAITRIGLKGNQMGLYPSGEIRPGFLLYQRGKRAEGTR